MRPDLKVILERLLSESEGQALVPLDAIGEAVGAMNITHAEIEALIDALESAGRQVDTRETGSAVVQLRAVLVAARELKASGHERPTVERIAEHSGLSRQAVGQALALARVMQR
ncbi:MAG: hypothetical protein H6718_30280 [Polyangiaceae bacterium]|nr:hypothetical protein [Myxococcales bacterium]MCB9589741.1 hypothetical protein [Polyangiaceae bacterium]